MYIDLLGKPISVYSVILVIELIIVLISFIPVLKKMINKEKEVVDSLDWGNTNSELRQEIIKEISRRQAESAGARERTEAKLEAEPYAFYTSLLNKILTYQEITEDDVSKVHLYNPNDDKLIRNITIYMEEIKLGLQ